jgi:hypothetical protein
MANTDRESFYDICKRTGTDKVVKHNYHLRYPMFFENLRDEPIKLFEMGVAGGKSIRMWEQYFECVEITGLDIKPRYEYVNTDETFIYVGDQRNERLLVEIVKSRGPFDIIIDDAGHRMLPQQIAFNVLFPTLKPGGWYVIEDLQTSYMRGFKGGYKHPNSTIEKIKTFIDTMHAAYIKGESDVMTEEVDKYPENLIDGMFLFEKIIFLRRKSDIALQPFVAAAVESLRGPGEPETNSPI